MKSTGIVRKLDELGRITLPVELRRTLNLNVKDPVEIYVDENQIVLKKFEIGTACHCCGKEGKLHIVYNLPVCEDCIKLYYQTMKKAGQDYER